MPKFNLFHCKWCLDKWGRPKMIEMPYSVAMAYPKCDICGATMSYAGPSDVALQPLAPPLPSLLMELQLDKARPFKSGKEDKVLIEEEGLDTSERYVSVKVTKQYGQMAIVIELTVDEGEPFFVRFHSRLLKKNGSDYKDYLVSSPFPVQGQTNCWLRLDGSKLNDWNGISQGDKLPSPFFEVAMPLGGIKYGLIHLLAGHHQNTRTWLSGNNNCSNMQKPEKRGTSCEAQEQFLVAMEKYNTDHAEEESYRSFMGILEGLSKSFKWENLQGIIKADDDKYVIVGKDKEAPVKLVVKKAGTNYTVTTLFRALDYSITTPNLKGGEKRVWIPKPK